MVLLGNDKLKRIAFLPGAGASVDAGMPTVKRLTEELRGRLPTLSDVNRNRRPEFGQIFDLIQEHDPTVAGNYERFFEWIKLILDVQKEPFRRIIETKILNGLIDAMRHLTSVVGGEIARLLGSVCPTPDYLTRLADFTPKQGRLKVFSLNYDCCVEDACQSAGIELTTGFDRITKKWKPSLFRSRSKGLNLYKLHGSLRWFGSTDTKRLKRQLPRTQVLVELRPEDRENLPPHIEIEPKPEPELVLGPGNKIQPDDPFLTLFYEFQVALRRAKVCVIIGYGYQDSHINSALDRAVDKGIRIIDVNSGGPASRYIGTNCYYHLPLSAKAALISDKIKLELEKLKL